MTRNYLSKFLDVANSILAEYNQQYLYDDNDEKKA